MRLAELPVELPTCGYRTVKHMVHTDIARGGTPLPPGTEVERDRGLGHRAVACTELSPKQRPGPGPRGVTTCKGGSGCLQLSFGLTEELNRCKVIVKGGLPALFLYVT